MSHKNPSNIINLFGCKSPCLISKCLDRKASSFGEGRSYATLLALSTDSSCTQYKRSDDNVLVCTFDIKRYYTQVGYRERFCEHEQSDSSPLKSFRNVEVQQAWRLWVLHNASTLFIEK